MEPTEVNNHKAEVQEVSSVLMNDLRQIIDKAQVRVASTANYELTMMYWHIGERINRDVLGNERAAYGKRIVATVSRQLPEIDGMLFERTAIAQKPDELIKQELAELRDDNKLSPDLVFKSPYFLEFTGLKGCYSEKSLEDSLVANLEQFILELGNGFTFVERQKRMIIDGEDFYHL